VAFSKTRTTPAKQVVAGKTFTFTRSIKNTGSTQLKGLYFQLELPAYLVPIKATASKTALAGGPGILLEDQYVWFRKMQLPAHKTLRVKVKIGVQNCQPVGLVQIQGIAYQLESTDQVVCSKAMAPYAINVVRKPGWSKLAAKNKRATWDDDNCITPAPAPTSTYNLVAENRRCLEARLLGTRHRRLETVEQQGHGERRLAITYTPNQCYQACADYLQVTTTPYYFNVDSSGQCYCCKTCLAVYNPNFTVSLVWLFSQKGSSQKRIQRTERMKQPLAAFSVI
jgi:hypothetical protein